MNSHGSKIWRALIACVAVAASLTAAHARDKLCYTGYDSRECVRLQKALQERLLTQYTRFEEGALRALGDSYDAYFKNELLQSLRATNAAYQAFKDAECYSAPLRDGMSVKDAAVMADQCRVDWRRARIAQIEKVIRNQSAAARAPSSSTR